MFVSNLGYLSSYCGIQIIYITYIYREPTFRITYIVHCIQKMGQGKTFSVALLVNWSGDPQESNPWFGTTNCSSAPQNWHTNCPGPADCSWDIINCSGLI